MQPTLMNLTRLVSEVWRCAKLEVMYTSQMVSSECWALTCKMCKFFALFPTEMASFSGELINLATVVF